MTAGEFTPDTAPEKVPMTPAEIYDQLRMIAFINNAFRAGKTNSYGFTTGQDPVLKGVDPTPLPQGWQEPYTTKAFRFEATRLEAPDASTVLDFTYGYSKAQRNIQMPEHIAAYAYGAKKDPVRAAGPSSMIQSIDVAIDSEDFDVSIRETVEYLDSKGHHVVTVNSDPYPDELKRTVFPRKPLTPSTSPEQGKPIDVETVLNYDIPLTLRTDAVHFYQTLENPPKSKKFNKIVQDFDHEYQDLIIATKVLKRMKKSFRNQLGMKI